jgi:hypothetical protein
MSVAVSSHVPRQRNRGALIRTIFEVIRIDVCLEVDEKKF